MQFGSSAVSTANMAAVCLKHCVIALVVLTQDGFVTEPPPASWLTGVRESPFDYRY